MKHQSSKTWLALLFIVAGIGLMAIAAWQIFGGSDESSPGFIQTQPAAGSQIERTSVESAYAAYLAGEAVFIDVRGDEAYALSHIPGAISIPLEELPDQLNKLNAKDWIIPYCT